MSGYTPVFDSVFQGTLCGKYPDLPVWLVLLALQQRGGIIDAHPSYIATVSGLPQSDIELAISRFCEPDPASRTPDNDGRRLVPLEGKGFGWKVVNHDRYREKARKQAYDEKRTESGADAERKKAQREASRDVPTCPDASRAVPLSEAEAKTDKRGANRATSRCPADFIPDPEFAAKECPDMDVPRETEKFRDWEFKKPRKDWSATWRAWVRSCRDSGRYARKPNGGLPNVYGPTI